MIKIFEATRYTTRVEKKDFSDETEARNWVESVGEGRITTFIRGSDGRDRSCALNSFHPAGGWKGHDISR